MLKCKHLVDSADLLIDNVELRPGQRLSLHLHLLMCRHCRRYLRQLDALTKHLRGRNIGPVDDAQVETVLHRIDRA